MEYAISPTSAARPQSPPTYQPDQRPAADAAALARNTNPDVPLPIPAGFGPVASVNMARIPTIVGAVTPVERTLKPYGVTMLPHGPSDKAIDAAKTHKHGSENVQA